jgi:hypothetical protein
MAQASAAGALHLDVRQTKASLAPISASEAASAMLAMPE